jgi:glucan biosynthesis protein C
MIHDHVSAELTGDMRILMVALFVTHAWLAVTGWFGVCLRWLDHEPPSAVRYVAAASFWIYLLHHPVVGLAQVSLRTMAIPVTLKFVLSLTVGLALPLLTYEVLVRRTWIGLVLNGRQETRVPATSEKQIEERVVTPTRRAA